MVISPEEFCLSVRASLVKSGIFSENGTERNWRISPMPFELSQQDNEFFVNLGNHLLIFEWNGKLKHFVYVWVIWTTLIVMLWIILQ